MKRILWASQALAALLFCCTGTAAQSVGEDKRMAVVELSANFMRSRPDYESGLETQELMGTIVEITGEDRYWREIVCPQPYRAWATSLGLVEMTADELAAYRSAPKFIFTSPTGYLYEKPDADSGIVCDLVGGDLLRALPKEKYTGLPEKAYGWKQLECKGRWACAVLPSGKKGYLPKEDIAIHHLWLEKTRPTVKGILSTAEQMMGVPYLWGGMSFKGVDCSGLVRVSCLMNNFYLPRNASQMVRCGKEVRIDVRKEFWNGNARTGKDRKGFSKAYISEMKERVKNLRKGDLVFFGYPAEGEKKERITHVGIYIGGGRIIHSSHIVRKNSLIPGEDDFYENSHKLIRARRLEVDEL